MRHILNATALGVAFLLPPLSVDVCMRAKCHALGGLLTSGGELLRGFSGRFKVLEVCGTCSHREDVVWSGGNAEGSPVFAFFAKSRFDSFEVCPGVGIVVTAVVACGVPEWWHSFGYGWYLYPVWVMVCGGLGVIVVERTSGVELVLLLPLTFRSCE
ncbi:hypothetical protein Taro_032613 [Colocasia esculenta]|uniref:Secreted protein n=1 Tax=Colocasia esculenta TaxID=4460 RepID=A0A843W6L9_COLES|nr:hypothetical protein [Colocasia esculenta]